MTCKKCGEILDGNFDFCPKCGHKLKKRKTAGKITGIILSVVLLGIGIFLFISGEYKNIILRFSDRTDETELADITVMNENDAGIKEPLESTEIEESIETTEAIESVPETTEQYLAGLSIAPVEMVIGETYLVELEKTIPNAKWTSSDESIVHSEYGQLKAVGEGNAAVTLSSGEEEVSFAVSVNRFRDMTLAVNYSKTLEINDAISVARWESSAPEIVSVDDGVITSVAAGSATVTAYIDEEPYSFEVVATTPEITTDSVRKIIGNTQQISVLGTNGTVEWKSDNTAIATVSDTGLITAEGTGAGQSTVVHAYVDGMEFKIDVAVEPIPQLSSTYKIFGHQDDSTYKNARATLCTNANETITYTCNDDFDGHLWGSTITKNVLNVADADYSDGITFPLYHTFSSYSVYGDKDELNYTDVYLVGTSQVADVIIEQLVMDKKDKGLFQSGETLPTIQSESVVTYEACENYGIIHIYYNETVIPELVTVSVDGYQYQFVVTGRGLGHNSHFSYLSVDGFPENYMVEECSVDEIIVPEKVTIDYAALEANSRTYNPGTGWLERIGGKFVESIENQAIDMAAGALLSFIF